MKKILFITDKFLPTTSGGNIDVNGQLLLLNQLDKILIDVIIADENEYPHREILELPNINKISVYKQNKYSKLRKLFSILPYNCFWFYDLLKYHTDEYYDFVICQSEYSAIVTKKVKYDKLVIRVHNDEIGLFLNNNKLVKNRLVKLFGYLNMIKLHHLRNKYYEKAYALLFISSHEKDYLRNKFPSSVSLVIPPYYKSSNLLSKSKYFMRDRKVLFLGVLNKLNLQGLKWYFNNIHFSIKKELPNYMITIAGKDCGENIQWLYNLALADKSISIDTNLSKADIYELYETHCIAINPMQNGNGTKIKTIEYIYNGVPVISTLIGAEGNLLADCEGMFIANNKKLFIDKILQLFLDQNTAYEILNRGQIAINILYQNNLKQLNRLFQDNCE